MQCASHVLHGEATVLSHSKHVSRLKCASKVLFYVALVDSNGSHFPVTKCLGSVPVSATAGYLLMLGFSPRAAYYAFAMQNVRSA